MRDVRCVCCVSASPHVSPFSKEQLNQLLPLQHHHNSSNSTTIQLHHGSSTYDESLALRQHIPLRPPEPHLQRLRPLSTVPLTPLAAPHKSPLHGPQPSRLQSPRTIDHPRLHPHLQATRLPGPRLRRRSRRHTPRTQWRVQTRPTRLRLSCASKRIRNNRGIYPR